MPLRLFLSIRRRLVSARPHTNAAGFFITCAPAEWSDGRHVVFGHVAAGMEVRGTHSTIHSLPLSAHSDSFIARQVLAAIEAVGSEGGQTSALVTIEGCGQLR